MLVSSGEPCSAESPGLTAARRGGGSGEGPAGGEAAERSAGTRWTWTSSIRQIVWHPPQTVTAPGRVNG